MQNNNNQGSQVSIDNVVISYKERVNMDSEQIILLSARVKDLEKENNELKQKIKDLETKDGSTEEAK